MPASSSMRPEISTARPTRAALFNYGTVFKLTPNQDGSWTESVLHSFNGSDGERVPMPASSSMRPEISTARPSGRRFWLRHGFQADAESADGSWTESVLYSFIGGSDGADPYAGLIFDAAGNLYGTTVRRRLYGTGHSLQADPERRRKLDRKRAASLQRYPRSNPYAGLIFDGAGNLYGTTADGGVAGWRRGFQTVAQSGWKLGVQFDPRLPRQARSGSVWWPRSRQRWHSLRYDIRAAAAAARVWSTRSRRSWALRLLGA